MRPDVFTDSYKRYKSGTNAIAVWLVETARACGDSLEFLNSKSQSKKPVKNRKYLMPLSEFIRLAEVIAEHGRAHKTKIKVPLSVLSSIREVLNLRKQASRYFQGMSHDDDVFEANNKAHLHIISILEHVLQSLEPLGQANSKSQSAGKRKATKDTTTDPPINLFDALELEEADENVGSELVTWSGKLDSEGQHSLVSFKVERPDDDLPFAIYCLYKDLNEIRTFIRETWEDYKNEKTPLVAASIVTDIAFELVERREKEFLATVELPENFPKQYVRLLPRSAVNPSIQYPQLLGETTKRESKCILPCWIKGAELIGRHLWGFIMVSC